MFNRLLQLSTVILEMRSRAYLAPAKWPDSRGSFMPSMSVKIVIQRITPPLMGSFSLKPSF